MGDIPGRLRPSRQTNVKYELIRQNVTEMTESESESEETQYVTVLNLLSPSGYRKSLLQHPANADTRIIHSVVSKSN